MERCYFSWRVRWFLLAFGGIGFGAPHLASAQPAPSPGPAAPPSAAVAPPPGPAAPSSAADLARESELLKQRVRQLEVMLNQLSQQVKSANTPPKPAAGGDPGRPGTSAGSRPASPPAPPGPNMPTAPLNIPGKVKFGPGFEISTDDNEYQFQYHNLTQVDYRGYERGGQLSTRDTFVLPRQWYIFAGRLTKPFEYFISWAEGIDTLNMLWTYLNIHYDDRLQLKIGRVFTPFGYEWYQVPTAFLINPERSLWTNNFTPASDIGIYAWGQLFKKRVDYAVGIFNGTRNSFVDANDEKDVIAFLNFKPFLESDIQALKYLNVGGSALTGNEGNLPIPSVLRTNVQTGGNLALGPEFLAFNNNVRESGWRSLWNLHMAYYYRHLSVYGEWQTGFQDYAFASTPRNRTHLPVNGFYVSAGYFLTGETVTARNIIRPNRDFDIRKGRRGPGAIELTARYSLLDIGNQVFTNGLADPNLWTNRIYSVDVGVNWYLTRVIKLYLGWEHDVFGSPVIFAPNRRQSTVDQAWLRFQIFF